MARRMVFAVVALSLVAGGCTSATSKGSMRNLGAVQFDEAYDTARLVLREYSFEIDHEDTVNGLLVSAPLYGEEPSNLQGQRSLGRRTATVQLYRDGKTLSARAYVMVERQSASVRSGVTGVEGQPYDEVPHQTPAEEGIATGQLDRDSWRRVGQDRRLESMILADLFDTLHHRPTTGPTTTTERATATSTSPAE